jgi:hypothetical protein
VAEKVVPRVFEVSDEMDFVAFLRQKKCGPDNVVVGGKDPAV